MERPLIVLIIIILTLSAMIVGAVAYFTLQPSGHYHSLLMFQWGPPPMTNATAAFTTNGKQWYIEWTFVSYNLVSSSLQVSVRDASTNALVDQANLTNQQRTHYFNEKGKFYLSLQLNNATTLEEGQLILVDVWELG